MFDKKYLSLTYALLIVSLVLQLISFCIFDSIEMLLLSGIICIAAFVLQFKIWENKNENIIPNIITSLVFTLICGVFSLWLAGIPLLINAVFILMTNYGYGIGDFYTGMVMVDSNKFFSQGHKVKEVVLPYIKKEGEEIDEFE